MPPTVYQRCCRASLAVAVISLPLVVWGAIRALDSNANDPNTWVPITFPARAAYEQFRGRFENGDVVVASWLGCTVDDPRLEQLKSRLEQPDDASTDARGEPYFERVLTGYNVLRELTARPLALPREEALRRLRGSLVGPDLQTSCAVVVFTSTGVRERDRAVAFLRHVIDGDLHVPDADLRLAGPIMDGLTVDEASAESLNQFAGFSALLILLLCWRSLRSFREAFLIFALAFYCEGLTLSLVYWLGDQMNALLIVAPPMVLVLGVSGGIHLVNYYHDALAVGGRQGASARAMRLGWLPCFLSAGTTAIGLASLMVSDLLPIRLFGLYAAMGAMLTLAVLFLVVPGAFDEWPALAKRRAAVAPAPANATAAYAPRNPVASFVSRHHALVTSASVAVMIAAAVGVPRIRTSVKLQTLFAPQSRILQDYAWLEKNVMPLVSIEVLVHFDSACPLPFVDRLRLVTDVQNRLAAIDEVGGTMSGATFAPDFSGAGQGRAIVQDVVLRRKLRRLRYLSENEGLQVWRVTARVGALTDLDYGHFLHDIQEHLAPLLLDERGQPLAGVSTTYTGVMSLVAEVQRQLMMDLFNSFLSAFGVISVVMLLVERGLWAAIVAMIPNVFPLLLMFGLLGWLGRPMDIGSVMTASIALGMAIDGTLHFLTFFRRGVRRGATASEAVQQAFQHCAVAMTQSAVICGFGLLVFALSSFVPTSRFAWMILALLFAALAGDLIVLPALLVGPLGRVFLRQERQSAGAIAPTSDAPRG